MGIVYSWMTAAAMWQNFRARLPFLYDPWSEQLPPPPTLMHAMIAISALVEGLSIAMGLVIYFFGGEHLGVALAVLYGLGACIVSLVTAHILAQRGVRLGQVWYWQEPLQESVPSNVVWSGDEQGPRTVLRSVGLGLVGGVGLGMLAKGYLALLLLVPAIAEMIRIAHVEMTKVPGLQLGYSIIAVGVAPFAEEYLFRGLLFRALDREWGGWRAVSGSAVFFAIYHPPLAWVPVGILGVMTALLFRKTRRLASTVILHMAYNAVVVLY
jgi:membrane protease YdiL (CAAX protease family)